LDKTGIVVEVNGRNAVVRFERSKECGKCRGCTMIGDKESAVEIKNTLNAEVGDTVGIELHARSVITASLLLYVIPLAALILGLFLFMPLGELWATVGGIACALLVYAVIKLFEPYFKQTGEFDPKMIKILERNEETHNGSR
jgi:sigma-E factor negative regulatory protein RseC